LRQAILQTSLEVGAELGEEGLTMRGIAARLKVSATALYQHFESKGAILREIRVYGVDLLMQEVIEPCRAEADPLRRLRCMGERYVDFARAQPWLYTVLMQGEQIDWSTMSPAEVEQSLGPLNTLRGWLREGAERGQIRAGLDPDMLSFGLWATFHGLCSMLISGRIDENHVAFSIANQREFIRNFLDGTIASISA
jgi:AcrR family transcriptional regulator